MKILSVLATIATIAVVGPTNESQAQTVQDDSGDTYFQSRVEQLCGPRAKVYLAPHSATIVLSGEYIQNRNLDTVAHNLAISGLSIFPNSAYFAVRVQDSRGSGYAEVNR